MLSQYAGGKKTVEDRLNEFSETVHQRLRPYFEKQGVEYPPDGLILVGLKNEARLEIWGFNEDCSLKLIKIYPVLAGSGQIGPKSAEGDRQVPEGIYKIESLNPNSSFHLSLKIDYPNPFDKAVAEEEGRRNLGGDIFIHGDAVSVGCLAVGDEAAEDLFVLAADTGLERIKVVLAPIDFRESDLSQEQMEELPSWCGILYAQIKNELNHLRGI